MAWPGELGHSAPMLLPLTGKTALDRRGAALDPHQPPCRKQGLPRHRCVSLDPHGSWDSQEAWPRGWCSLWGWAASRQAQHRAAIRESRSERSRGLWTMWRRDFPNKSSCLARLCTLCRQNCSTRCRCRGQLARDLTDSIPDQVRLRDDIISEIPSKIQCHYCHVCV